MKTIKVNIITNIRIIVAYSLVDICTYLPYQENINNINAWVWIILRLSSKYYNKEKLKTNTFNLSFFKRFIFSPDGFKQIFNSSHSSLSGVK